MKIAVKILLFVNMVVAIAVVSFGYLTYRDREIIKARTVILERNAEQLAKNLQWGGAVDWEAADERKGAAYVLPGTAEAAEVPALQENLAELSGLAKTRVEQLTKRWEELVQTRKVLADTEDQLRTRERELSDARTRISNLDRELVGVQNELREANRTVAGLRDEKAALERNVANLTGEMEKLQSKSQTLLTEIARIEGSLKRASDLLAACLNPQGPSGRGAKDYPWKDVPATILAVDTEWNLAILDKGEVDTLPMFLEAFVHRDEKFIGKIRVIRVENAVAIAEILTDTLVDGAVLQAGDTVFF